MLYEWIKIIHIIGSAVLFGGGIGSTAYFIFVNQQGNLYLLTQAVKRALMVAWILMGVSAALQFVTGLLLLFLNAASLLPLWVLGGAIAYLVALIVGVFSIYMQTRCYDLLSESVSSQVLSDDYHWYYKCWKWLATIVLFSLLCVLYFMIAH